MIPVSVVLPAYNEENALRDVLSDIEKVAPSLPSLVEIIFVNDGSKDKTGEILSSWTCPHVLKKVVNHPINYGYGAALHSGCMVARGDVIVTMDGDGQHQFRDAIALGLSFRDNKKGLELMIGKRTGDPLSIRRAAKFFLNCAQRLLTGLEIKDANSGMKSIKPATYKLIGPHLPGGMSYSQALVILIGKLDPRFIGYYDIPTKERIAGESKVTSLDFLRALKMYTDLSLKLCPNRVGMLLSGVFFTGGLVWGVPFFLQGKGIPNLSVLLFIVAAGCLFYHAILGARAAEFLQDLKQKIIALQVKIDPEEK